MAKTSRLKPVPKSTKRRLELRKTLGPSAWSARTLLQRPELIHIGFILVGFVTLMSIVVAWSQEQPRVTVGDIMSRTRLKRLNYSEIDAQATARLREDARRSSPRIYLLNDSYLDRLEAALRGLPTALAGKMTPDEVSAELREEFVIHSQQRQQKLTPQALTAIQSFASDQPGAATWHRWVHDLIHRELRFNPLLESDEYQLFTTTLYNAMYLPTGEVEKLGREVSPIALAPSAEIARVLDDVVRDAGFPKPLDELVYAKLLSDRQPTMRYDPQRTESMAAAASEAVPGVYIEHKIGDPIFRRGDQLTSDQRSQLNTEIERFKSQASTAQLWFPRLGIAGLVALLTLFGTAYIGANYPRIVQNITRMLAITALLLFVLMTAVWVSARVPGLLYPAAFAGTLIVSITMMLAYDQRLAVFVGGLQCTIMTMALQQNIAWLVLLVAANGLVIAQLHELRHRNSLIRASASTGAFVMVGVVLHGLYDLPVVPGTWAQIVLNSGASTIATVSVGFLMLGILPSVERLFDITTGMTLAELRDTKQPLLRQLQQKAPGTYNHSLQVANIAEAAAEAIGADSLLVYVGALYHDIGKMNKPDYFVENQQRGRSKHEGLSPAMSLLVIIGHVKDGVELAKEYNLPRSIQHFIESHHGTTLVEYFFHAAKERAEDEDKSSVNEFEYRYPGPKPRTKEAAILMLCDAVESATRAMAEPNPGRIENLVRKLSRKRLMDGQFDQCDLTFRELSAIEEAAVSRLCAIHHGRISYPGSEPSQTQDSGIDSTGPEQITKSA